MAVLIYTPFGDWCKILQKRKIAGSLTRSRSPSQMDGGFGLASGLPAQWGGDRSPEHREAAAREPRCDRGGAGGLAEAR